MQLRKNVVALGLAAIVAGAAADHKDDKQSKSNPSTASVTDDNQGPAAFMWPPDRYWSSKTDNTAPCGTDAGPGVRTKFPLTKAVVSLVGQDDYYNSKISISHLSDPKSNSDFSTVLESKDISDLNPGHKCVSIPDAANGVKAGDNATLQIIYKADWDAPHNQTFYACADITYVDFKDFKEDTMCINREEPGEDDKKADKAVADGASGGSSSGSGLGPGAIAGAVIGSLVGVSSVAAVLILLFRRRQQKKRQLRLARMEENARRDDFAMHKYQSSQNS